MIRLLAASLFLLSALISGAEEMHVRRPLPPRRIPVPTNAPPKRVLKTISRDQPAKSGWAEVDLLLAYDRAARLWVERKGGGITNFAYSAVDKANDALRNSGLGDACRFRLASIVCIDDNEADVPTALDNISGDNGKWAAVRRELENCGADIAVTMIDTGSEYGVTGQSYALCEESDLEWLGDWAFSVCAVRAVANSHTMTHEVGHLFGAGHSDEQTDDAGPLLYPYSSGYYFNADGEAYHTVMAYDEDGRGNYYKECPYFSTPNAAYRGVAVGTDMNDNARTLRETFPKVAEIRQRPYTQVPVVMLHGWNSDSSIWKRLRELLCSDAGYQEGELMAVDMDLIKPIEDLAKDVVKEINARFPFGEIDIVAHSMGGLVARSMLAQELLPKGRVRRLVTLGTPHYGVIGGVDIQSAQMIMGSTFLWNLAESWFAGDKRPADTLCIVGATTKLETGAYTDGLVPASSASLAGEKVFHVNKYHADVYSSLGEVIYAMDGGNTDIVYKATKQFLLTGTAPDDSESDCAEKVLNHVYSYGGVLARVVDEAEEPIHYSPLFRASGNYIIYKIDGKEVKHYVDLLKYEGDYVGIASTYADIEAGLHELKFKIPKDKWGDDRSIAATNKLMVLGGTYSLYHIRVDGDDSGTLKPLCAVPEENQYVIRFYNSGGGGHIGDMFVGCGSVINLPRCNFSAPDGGKRFAGWRGSNGIRYDDGILAFGLAEPGKTINMKAIWE